ncbi:endonuclease NucS [Halovenus marina]|uniref:endonuclease NucS n=1 Tax=Halovenus marina TaxID=3396621 RepID=UPI003F550181
MDLDAYPLPDTETIAEVVETGLQKGDVITIFANCDVEYEGRASGYLGVGERLIIAKPDGTLLVHRPTGNDPANWQPPGSSIFASVDDDGCTITARRSDPIERVNVHLRGTYHIVRYPAEDSVPLELSGTETEMHEYILDNPDEVEQGLRVLEHERETPYGTIDIFATDSEGLPVVIEVKRRQATLSHVDQLKRYMDQYRESNPNARGILVAPDASDRVRRTLRDNDLEFGQLEEFAVGRGDVTSTTFDDFL